MTLTAKVAIANLAAVAVLAAASLFSNDVPSAIEFLHYALIATLTFPLGWFGALQIGSGVGQGAMHPAVALFCVAAGIILNAYLWGWIISKITRIFHQKQEIAEPSAAPNGGPATPVGKSRVTEGPPSVS